MDAYILLIYSPTIPRLKPEDLELLRNWRNADPIRANMEFRQIISAEQQEAWYESLRADKDFYFIFSKQGKKIGMVNAKNLDKESQSAETGIITGEKEFLSSPEPVLAVLALMEFLFLEMDLAILYAKYASQNAAIQKFNAELGFLPVNKDELKEFRYYSVTKDRFFSYTTDIRLRAERTR